MHAHAHMYTCTCTHVHMHTHTRMHAHAHMYTCTHTLPHSLTQVNHVVLFDFPNTIVDYLHRVGRTGRVGSQAGCKTTAFMTHKRDVRMAWKIKVGHWWDQSEPNQALWGWGLMTLVVSQAMQAYIYSLI